MSASLLQTATGPYLTLCRVKDKGWDWSTLLLIESGSFWTQRPSTERSLLPAYHYTVHYSTCTKHTSRLSALWNICWKRFDFDLFGRVKASGLGVLLVVCKTTKVTCGLSSNASSKWSLSISGMMMDGCENGNTVQTMWPTREDFSNKKKNRREITASDAGDRIIDLQLTQEAVPQCFGKNDAIWLVKNVYEVCRQFNILYDRYFCSFVDLIVITKRPSINTPPHTHTLTHWRRCDSNLFSMDIGWLLSSASILLLS